MSSGFYYVSRRGKTEIEYNSKYMGFKSIIGNKPEPDDILMKVPSFEEYNKILERLKRLEKQERDRQFFNRLEDDRHFIH